MLGNSFSRAIRHRSTGSLQAVVVGKRASSRVGYWETYNASKLLLDIEAADSKYVKPFEQWQAEQQSKELNQTASDTTGKKTISPASSSQLDAALIAGTHRGEHSNLNPSAFRVKSGEILSRDLNKLFSSLSVNLESDNPEIYHEIVNKITTSISFMDYAELDWAVDMLCRSPTGLRLLNENARFFVRRVRHLKGMEVRHGQIAPYKRSLDILKFTGNLIARVEAGGLRMSIDLCRAGLIAAMSLNHRPAIDHYLRPYIRARYSIGWINGIEKVAADLQAAGTDMGPNFNLAACQEAIRARDDEAIWSHLDYYANHR
jgi:hypothetical protein